MATLGLINIGALATGVLASPRLPAEAILVENGRIAAVGAASTTGAAGVDVVVDCRGTTVIPGLIEWAGAATRRWPGVWRRSRASRSPAPATERERQHL